MVFGACKDWDKGVKTGIPVINPNDSTQFTKVVWLDSLVDFGTIKEGEKVDIRFRFKNTGSKILIIESVNAGCGCTNVEYPHEPIEPGKEGVVKATFNSSNQPPTVHKNVYVAMNTKERSYTVSFIGEVKK